ncbi:hypothetical protein DM02DRAFT_706780 [Periconia macrospinosa]|uniref:Nephrocystin 3-like N-terminal domain-containing protein n=1 Tax=Periconia macrospinosa TaxID=97972 RepID=A0A2V1DUJ5_9PLEO|nr:hypothetical protein DM02DRAFT_706780 [Periconia macrospinosa]
MAIRKGEVQELINDIQQYLCHLLVALQNNSRKVLHNLKARSEEQSKALDKLTHVLQTSMQNNNARERALKNKLSQISQTQEDIADNVNKIRVEQDGQMSKEERQAISKWLPNVVYQFQQSQYYTHLSRRLENTRQWLLGSTVYTAWVKADRQTLFCPGPPGAGKSILTSVIIQDLKTLCRNHKSVGLAFTYCVFKRQNDQSLQNVLAGLSRQLVERQPVVPESIRKLYQGHEEGADRPLLKEVLKILQIVIGSYSKVYILIDALDECQKAT